jgi:hypothetical protein
MSMPSFEELDLPAVIYAPQLSDGWVKTRSARWAELEEALRRRDLAAAAMVEDNERFAQACELLRPLMQANETMTVAEALLVLNTETKK